MVQAFTTLWSTTLAAGLLVLLSVFPACKSEESNAAVGTVEAAYARWTVKLRKGWQRLRFDNVGISSPRLATEVAGYRIWQGTYRGVDIAVYTYCVIQPVYREDTLGGVAQMGLVLAVERAGLPIGEPNYEGPPLPRQIIEPAERRIIPLAVINLDALRHEPVRTPPSRTWIDVGRWRARKVVFDKDSRNLTVEMKYTKPEAHVAFDLEKALVHS